MPEIMRTMLASYSESRCSRTVKSHPMQVDDNLMLQEAAKAQVKEAQLQAALPLGPRHGMRAGSAHLYALLAARKQG